MAAAPFKLITTTPGDTDIVSQFPNLDRGDKDVVQSWLNIDHNVDGTHSKAQLVQVGVLLSDGTTTVAAPTPAASRTAIYRDTDGALKTKRGEDSTVEFLGGVPPGFIGHTASATIPQGWLLCDGSAVSRSTFARLFTALGTLYGAGDGSTTFNVPDLRGRAIFGKDGASRITVAGGNFDGTVLGGVGGLQNQAILQANLPNVNFTVTATAAAHTHTYFVFLTSEVNSNGGTSPGAGGNSSAVSHTTGSTGPLAVTGTAASGGSGTALPTVPPAIILNPIIRT